MSEKQHLQPGFDPKTLKVSELRGILTEHEVSYPSNAKKSQLVEIFNNEVAPHASRLLEQHLKAISNKNDRGFIDVELDENSKAKSTRRRRTVTPQPPVVVEPEPEPKPKPKHEQVSIDLTSPDEDESPFTNDNVFQSPSSPSFNTKKRKQDENDEEAKDTSTTKKGKRTTKKPKTETSPISSPKVKSPKSPSVKKKQVKSLFDDDTDDSFLEDQLAKSITIKPKVSKSTVSTPKVVKTNVIEETGKSAPPKSAPPKVTPVVKSPKVTPAVKSPKAATPKASTPTVKSPKASTPKASTPKASTPKASTPKASTPKAPKVSSPKTSTPKASTSKVTKPASLKKATPGSSKSVKKSSSPLTQPATTISEVSKSFQTVEEELEDFDKQLQNIKNGVSTVAQSFINNDDLKLAKELGINIEGLHDLTNDDNQEIIDFTTPSKKFDKKTLLPDSALTPKPRLLPQFVVEKKPEEDDEDTEEENDDDEDEDDNEKVNTEDDKLIKELEKSIEQETEETETEETETEANVSSQRIRTSAKKSLTSLFLSLFVWVILITSGFLSYWYYQQLFYVGYCGQEIELPTFAGEEYHPILQIVGQFLDNNFKPKCQSCPLHARCFPYLEVGCYEDFIEFKPWDNFLYPYNKICVPDSKKAEKLEIMIEVALDLLRSKNANSKCGQNANIEESGIKSKDLHDLLLSMKAPYITNEEFEELWKRAEVELEKEPEITTGYSTLSTSYESSTIEKTDETMETSEDKILRSTSLSNLDLACQFQNNLTMTVFHYKYHIIIFIILFTVIKFIQYKYNQYQLNLIKIDIIYQEVLKKLRHQRKSSTLLPNVNEYIGSNQLRDLILINEKNLTTKLNLWNIIQKKIELNSNISVDVIEDHGEIIKVWKWISDI
ncbi:spliced mRNA and cell cycle regulated protein [Scheffersomyces amazonensis]|uniref:spliced mRNA and cell cycle regulated protein n=1 Tax=Scheffersomyces amazonensis TaxID=1078765 RepID=UPI00315DC047